MTEFLKIGFPNNIEPKMDYENRNFCYYHHPRNKENIKTFSTSTLNLLINEKYACKMVIPFLKIKLNELSSNRIIS